MNTIPFTYVLKFKPTEQYYYGVRYAVGCNPDNLWNTYFTSSDKIHELIDKFGKDSFTYKITKTFNSSKEAVEHEHKFLSRVNAMHNGKFINLSNGQNSDFTNKGLITIYHELTDIETFHNPILPIPKGFKPGFSKQHRASLSKVFMGLIPWNKEKQTGSTGPCTESRKRNISNARLHTEKNICPHCNKSSDPGNYKRFHGDNCKHNPNVNPDLLIKRSLQAKEAMKLQKERGTYKKPIQKTEGNFCQYCKRTFKNSGALAIHEKSCKLKSCC
jgi:hypothetical protein